MGHPAGLAAVDITNPQTWNRYAYVVNNPLNAVDPLGLYCAINPDGGTFRGCTQGAADYGWGGGEWNNWGTSPTYPDPYSSPWPLIITGIWDVFGGIGGGGGGSHPSSGGGSGSNPYTNPTPTGNGNDNNPYTFHTWVSWPFLSAINGKLGTLLSVPGIKDLIMESNNAFNQCVRKGALGAAGTGLTTTFWDRKNNPDPVLNVADLSVGLQADCLTEHPLAAADPNYRGLFLPGNPGVDPIIEILGWKY